MLLDLPNYTTNKELEHATADTSDLPVKKGVFFALKAEFYKLDSDKLANLETCLNDVKTKIDHLYIGNLKTVPQHFKKISDVVDKEAVKKTVVYNILNSGA